MKELFRTDETLIMEYFEKAIELVSDNKNLQMLYLEKLCKEKKIEQVKIIQNCF